MPSHLNDHNAPNRDTDAHERLDAIAGRLDAITALLTQLVAIAQAANKPIEDKTTSVQ